MTTTDQQGDRASRHAAVREAELQRNIASGARLVFDPYPVIDELREHGAVVEIDVSAHFGIAPMPGQPTSEHTFTAIGYDAVEQVFRDNVTFSSAAVGSVVAQKWGANILFMDEPEHRTYRALAQPAFAIKTMQSWEDRWLQPILTDLLAALPDEGRTDLYHEYCALFPVKTIASAFGIAPDDAERYHEWVLHMSGGGTPDQAIEAVQHIADSLRPTIEDRRATGNDDDVIGLLAGSEVADAAGTMHRLTETEILGFAYLMLTAGAGTTYRTFGFLLREVIANQELLARVRRDPDFVVPLVEETLRWSPPVLFFDRMAMVDTEVAGVRIPAGSVVSAMVGAANRDPARWDRPHEFDPDRERLPHVAFGNGPHFCIGNQLARMELRNALTALLDRYDSIELDPEEPYPETSGLRFRQIEGLPVVVG
jgi:cytochrome P450